MADFHPAVEEYLETILELEESGIPPIRARIAERLGVSAPAVSETVARLEREGYVGLDGRQIVLTAAGRTYATAVVRRHRLAERLLVDVLGVPWHQVHEEAARLEHAISDNLEAHLVALLDDPATCPHGNPIPGSARTIDPTPTQPLATAPAGERVRVRRIDEEIEARPEYMLLLEQSRLTPDDWAERGDRAGDDYPVHTESGRVLLPAAVAEKVYVSLAS